MLIVKRGIFVTVLLLVSAVAHAEIPPDRLAEGLSLQRQWLEQSTIRDQAEKEMARIHREAVKLRADLCREGHAEKCPPRRVPIFVTSYNPEVAQTDGDPCGGAGGNVCKAAKAGHRVLALSQDLIGTFKYGETVYLVSENPACHGEFLLLDTMNKRWTSRGDLFFLERKDNTSCHATLSDKPPTT